MVRAGEFSPNFNTNPTAQRGGPARQRRRKSGMDYEGLLSQKRAEESSFRSGWDPIGSPTGLSRSTGLGGFNLGGGPFMGNGLSSVESSLQRLDNYTTPSFSTDAGDLFTGGASSFGGGPSSFSTGGEDGMSNGNSMPGNAGDPGAQRRQMQANYRRELIRQAEEDRARKLAEKQREQEEAESGIFTINKPYELQAPNNNRRRRSDLFDHDPCTTPTPVKVPPYRLAIIPGLETLRPDVIPKDQTPSSSTTADTSATGYQSCQVRPDNQEFLAAASEVQGQDQLQAQACSTAVDASQLHGQCSAPVQTESGEKYSPRQTLARLATSLGLFPTADASGNQSSAPVLQSQQAEELARCQQYVANHLQRANVSFPQQPAVHCQQPAQYPMPPQVQYPNTVQMWGPQRLTTPYGGAVNSPMQGCGPAVAHNPAMCQQHFQHPQLQQCPQQVFQQQQLHAPMAVGDVRYLPDLPRPPPFNHPSVTPLPPIGATSNQSFQPCPHEAASTVGNTLAQPVVNAYGDEFAQQLEERRQRQERGRNNLLAFKQQDQQKRDSGFQYGEGTAQGGRGGNKPHVSETSFDRAQRSQSHSMQAELQQQIADKKRREAERKQQEAEEDAALNARLEEQQKKMRDDLQREKEARERKERSRLERQHVIEEQQRRALEQAEQLRRDARDRKLSTAAAAPASSWDTWTDDRPAGKQSSEDQWSQQKPADDPWDKPAEDAWEPQKPASPLKDLWNEPPRQETPPAPVKPSTPPPVMKPSHDTSDLAIDFDWKRAKTPAPEERMASPSLDQLAERNRERQRRLEERRRGGH